MRPTISILAAVHCPSPAHSAFLFKQLNHCVGMTLALPSRQQCPRHIKNKHATERKFSSLCLVPTTVPISPIHQEYGVGGSRNNHTIKPLKQLYQRPPSQPNNYGVLSQCWTCRTKYSTSCHHLNMPATVESQSRRRLRLEHWLSRPETQHKQQSSIISAFKTCNWLSKTFDTQAR